MDLPEGIEPPLVMQEYKNARALERSDDELVEMADEVIEALIDMVRRFYWQRNELLRLSTAYPAVMKEKLEKDWEARK